MLYSSSIGVATLFGNIIVSKVEDLGSHYKVYDALAIDVGQKRLDDGTIVNSGLMFGCINPLAKDTDKEVPTMTVELPKQSVMYFFEPIPKILEKYEEVNRLIKIAPASLISTIESTRR